MNDEDRIRLREHVARQKRTEQWFDLLLAEDLDFGLFRKKLEGHLRQGCPVASSTNALRYPLNFGKHAGKTVGQVLEEAPEYLDWLLGESEQLTKALSIALAARELSWFDKEEAQ